MFRPCSIFVQLLACRAVSFLLCCDESLQKDQQSYENPNDINPGSSDAYANMYEFDSCFDDLSSDATSAVQNVERKKSKNENARRSSSALTLKSELDKFCCLQL